MPEHLKKENLTVRVPNYIVEYFKSHDNYNQLIEKILEEYYNKHKESNKK